jgi:hypothetical protein
MGSLTSQLLLCDLTTFHRFSSTVLTYQSTMPFNCRCKGVVHALLTPRRCRTPCIRQDSKLQKCVYLTIASIGCISSFHCSGFQLSCHNMYHIILPECIFLCSVMLIVMCFSNTRTANSIDCLLIQSVLCVVMFLLQLH